MTWAAVIFLSLGAAVQRLIGMFAAGPLLERRPALADITALVPAAVVSALVVQLSFATADALVLDARAVGFVAAGILVWRKAPFVVVVLGTAAATAVVRLL